MSVIECRLTAFSCVLFRLGERQVWIKLHPELLREGHHGLDL